MMDEINTLKFHLSRITVTGAGSIPLALCIQAVERLEQKVKEAEQKNGEEAAENG